MSSFRFHGQRWRPLPNRLFRSLRTRPNAEISRLPARPPRPSTSFLDYVVHRLSSLSSFDTSKFKDTTSIRISCKTTPGLGNGRVDHLARHTNGDSMAPQFVFVIVIDWLDIVLHRWAQCWAGDFDRVANPNDATAHDARSQAAGPSQRLHHFLIRELFQMDTRWATAHAFAEHLTDGERGSKQPVQIDFTCNEISPALDCRKRNTGLRFDVDYCVKIDQGEFASASGGRSIGVEADSCLIAVSFESAPRNRADLGPALHWLTHRWRSKDLQHCTQGHDLAL